jgi:hypothetical protein
MPVITYKPVALNSVIRDSRHYHCRSRYIHYALAMYVPAFKENKNITNTLVRNM